jgi:hypothetical protein
MAYTDEQVEQWFKNNLDASEVEIVRAMQVSGVDPAQVSRVTGADPGYVASRFEAFTTAGPPSPAVSPVVANPISLTSAGTASLGQPTNVSSPANVFSPADYGPPSKNVYDFNRLIRDNEFGKAGELATGLGFAPEDIQSYLNDTNVFPEFGGNVELDTVQSFVPPPPAPDPQPYVDTVAQNLLGRFDQEMDAAMASGDYANVANVMKEAEGLYGPATYSTVADYLNTNPRYEGLRGQVGIDPSIEGGAAYTPENLQSFVSSIPAPVDPGIAGALPGGQGTTPLSFTDQLNALFQANLGRLPTEREASIYSKDFGGTFSPELEAAFMSRSTEEMGNRQKGIKEAADAAAKTETAKTTAPGVYQPTYTSYRQEGQAPFGGYYAQPGIGPYGGVFGVGTEQFEQQSDPFSGAQARARSLINNRLTPLTDNVPIDPRPPAPFGGYVAANDVAPNPFAYRQTLSPNTLAALATEATSASEAAASEAPMRRGGYINQGITAVRR